MDDSRERHDAARHTSRIVEHLDGHLEPATVEAMRGVWSLLEQVAPDGDAYGRAVRERLFWESLRTSRTDTVTFDADDLADAA